MTGPLRIGAFVALLIAVFAAAALAGGAIDPSGSDADQRADAGHGEASKQAGGHGGGEESGGAASEEHGEGGGETASLPPGLQVSDGGYRLVVDRPRRAAGAAAATVSFRILGPGGEPVRDFELEHEKRMHFIVVRRDLDRFQHLHPEMRPDGTWTARSDLRDAGTYRVFADFKVGGVKRTLGADVHVGGTYRPAALPAATRTARTDDGLTVRLRAGQLRAGAESRVAFTVTDGGRDVTDELDPYLGAKGHLVALREGDLAYLHTHPEDDELAFMAEYPSAGAYRLYVQFRYRGKVHTAAFTQEVAR